MIETFPWWIPALALIGVTIGIFFLRKYDFSYKRNFSFIVVAFVAAIILAAFVVDLTGINDTWFGQGPMRRLYQQGQQKKQLHSIQFAD